MTFKHRVVKVIVELSSDGFDADGNNRVEIEGVRCSADIMYAGLVGAKAQIRLWGLSLALMNKLTVTRQFFIQQRKPNRLTIEAGDDNQTSVCFRGGILEAWVDASQPPDVSFLITAASGLVDLAKPVAPTSYKGSVSAELLLSKLVEQMGYALENSGVKGVLQNPYKPGSLRSQIESVCRDVNCDFLIDETNKIVAIWPQGEARGGKVVKMSSSTGMVGYPSFSQAGVRMTSLYNPEIEFGRRLQVESQLLAANGTWKVYGLAHRLEAEMPNGSWFTDIECTYLSFKPA